MLIADLVACLLRLRNTCKFTRANSFGYEQRLEECENPVAHIVGCDVNVELPRHVAVLFANGFRRPIPLRDLLGTLDNTRQDCTELLLDPLDLLTVKLTAELLLVIPGKIALWPENNDIGVLVLSPASLGTPAHRTKVNHRP